MPCRSHWIPAFAGMTSPAMTEEGKGLTRMIELETELQELTPEDGYRLYAAEAPGLAAVRPRGVPAGA